MPGREDCATCEWSISRVYENAGCSVDAAVMLRRDIASEDGVWQERLGHVRLRIGGGVEGHLNELLLKPDTLKALRNLLVSSEGEEMVAWLTQFCDADPSGADWTSPEELLAASEWEEESASISHREQEEEDAAGIGETSGEDDDTELTDDDADAPFDYQTATNEELIAHGRRNFNDDEVLHAVIRQFMAERDRETWIHLLADVKALQERLTQLVRDFLGEKPAANPATARVVGQPTWPDTAQQSARTALKSDCYWYQEGVLSFMGYRVGHSSTVTEGQRRRILDYVFAGPLPKVNDPGYMAQWGTPRSSQRLRKMAYSLATFAASASRNRHADKRLAIAEWLADLEYLRQALYRPRQGHSWRWPQPE